MQTMNEVYHMYHRSVHIGSMIIADHQIDFDPPSSSNAHIMARWSPSISILDWLKRGLMPKHHRFYWTIMVFQCLFMLEHHKNTMLKTDFNNQCLVSLSVIGHNDQEH